MRKIAFRLGVLSLLLLTCATLPASMASAVAQQHAQRVATDQELNEWLDEIIAAAAQNFRNLEHPTSHDGPGQINSIQFPGTAENCVINLTDSGRVLACAASFGREDARRLYTALKASATHLLSRWPLHENASSEVTSFDAGPSKCSAPACDFSIVLDCLKSSPCIVNVLARPSLASNTSVSVRYDGLYRGPWLDKNGVAIGAEYLRFYADGFVVSVVTAHRGPTDLDKLDQKVAGWLTRDHTTATKGTYKIQGLKITFTTIQTYPKSDPVVIDFAGAVEDNGSTLVLDSYSHVNGHRETRRYQFIEVPVK